MRTKLSIAVCSCISLTYLPVISSIIFIVGELGFIIQYDTAQAPCKHTGAKIGVLLENDLYG